MTLHLFSIYIPDAVPVSAPVVSKEPQNTAMEKSKLVI